MHSLMIILGGLALLAICLLLGRLVPSLGMRRAALVFMPLWAVLSICNLWAGLRAGHSVASEIPYLILVFAVPALVAWLLRWKAPGH